MNKKLLALVIIIGVVVLSAIGYGFYRLYLFYDTHLNFGLWIVAGMFAIWLILTLGSLIEYHINKKREAKHEAKMKSYK